MSLFHKKKNTQPQQLSQKAKLQKQGEYTPFHKSDKGVIKGPKINPLGFFKIMFGFHPLNKTQRAQALKNADPTVVKEHQSIEAFKKGLHFPANLLTNKEMMRYYRMGSSHQEIERISIMRFFGSFMMGVLPALYWLTSHSKVALGLVILLPLMFWCFIGFGIKSSYKKFSIHQQYMFDILMSVLSPYLYQMNKANANSTAGAGSMSMNAILTTVSDRIRDQRTKYAVDKLNIDVEHDPNSFEPYEEFAREFSTSPMAYMFMSSVYRMAHGSTDASAIRNLNQSSMHDLLRQIDNIKEVKLKRFYNPPVVMFIDWFVMVLGYFIVFMWRMITNSMKGAHF